MINSVVNKRGLKIVVGSRVRYTGTATVSVVKEIELFDGRYWALLDKTGLYYDVDYLEPAEAPEKVAAKPVSRAIERSEEGKEVRITERTTEVTPSGAGCLN